MALWPNPQLGQSDHFDGSRFFNHEPIDHGFKLALKWLLNRDPGPWQGYRHEPPGPRPPDRVLGDELRVTYVNHATVLIQTAGVNLLTDPIWSERAGPVSFAGPRRVRPPGIRFEDLPPIDLVLLSHGHYDHFDIPTLKKLNQEHQPLYLTGLGQGAYLSRADITHYEELDWWQTHHFLRPDLPELNISSVPARHWTARWIGDQNRALWNGFVIHTPKGPVYFAGDTGYGSHFTRIKERFGSARLAILPIGAYRPEFFMADVHLSPLDALQAHRDLSAKASIAIHFGTFRLGDDGETEAIDLLAKALLEAQQPNQVHLSMAEPMGMAAGQVMEMTLQRVVKEAMRTNQMGKFWIPDFGKGINIDH